MFYEHWDFGNVQSLICQCNVERSLYADRINVRKMHTTLNDIQGTVYKKSSAGENIPEARGKGEESQAMDEVAWTMWKSG